eukprot:COSAG01_NODE_60585_length_294_cov_0.533333_1_plen_65_part_01
MQLCEGILQDHGVLAVVQMAIAAPATLMAVTAGWHMNRWSQAVEGGLDRRLPQFYLRDFLVVRAC